MIWIVIAASLLALAGVAYGVLVQNKKNEKLGLPQISKWNKAWVPLTLILADEFTEEESAKIMTSIKAAARFWNREVELKLFAPPGDVGSGGVIPVMRKPLTEEEHDSAVAYAHLTFRDDTLHAAAVYMSNWENLPSLDLDRAMKHEFGHCLGLEHDENTFSVMYGKLSRRVYCVSEADKEFLREVYG